jgi:hypothetical protein
MMRMDLPEAKETCVLIVPVAQMNIWRSAA